VKLRLNLHRTVLADVAPPLAGRVIGLHRCEALGKMTGVVKLVADDELALLVDETVVSAEPLTLKYAGHAIVECRRIVELRLDDQVALLVDVTPAVVLLHRRQAFGK